MAYFIQFKLIQHDKDDYFDHEISEEHPLLWYQEWSLKFYPAIPVIIFACEIPDEALKEFRKREEID